MKRWQKFAVLATVPTLSALHSRWIGHLLGVEWGDGAKVLALIVVVSSVVASAAWLCLFEGI